MQYLNCRAEDCIYNVEMRCTAHIMRVGATGQETYCDTYARADVLSPTGVPRGGSDIEVGVIGSPRITCSVTRCAYNQSFGCRAHGVHIGSPHDAMVCSCRTFRPK